MAGGRRHMPNRSHPIRPPPNLSTLEDSKISSRPSTDNITSLVPKHIPMPEILPDGALLYELIMFLYTATACALQFLHLYRSVWWLPTSYSSTAMNFYLVDAHLVGFIVTILSRQLVYCALHKLLSKCVPTHMWEITEKTLKIVLLTVVVCILIWCSLAIIRTHQLVNILYLGYPMSVYFILFGLHIGPFFSSADHGPEQIQGEVLHTCPPSAAAIRAEIERLKQDFNARMRHVLFSSVLSAYYAGFVPCCFAQSSLVYDLSWATQHLAFVWLGSFTMAASQVYPVAYVDTLHRAAVHLGRWTKLEGCRSHLPTHAWVDTTVWPCGSLVRHAREIFRAEGVSTVGAEPGNAAHARFYVVFNNPGLLYGLFLGLQGCLVLAQLGLLLQLGNEWWRGISLALMLFTNYYILFKIIRDTSVCWRLFKNEKLLQNKLVTG